MHIKVIPNIDISTFSAIPNVYINDKTKLIHTQHG